jgi:hypothetical protein
MKNKYSTLLVYFLLDNAIWKIMYTFRFLVGYLTIPSILGPHNSNIFPFEGRGSVHSVKTLSRLFQFVTRLEADLWRSYVYRILLPKHTGLYRIWRVSPNCFRYNICSPHTYIQPSYEEIFYGFFRTVFQSRKIIIYFLPNSFFVLF